MPKIRAASAALPCYAPPSTPRIRRQNHRPVHQHIEGVARPDVQRRLNVQVLVEQVRADGIDLLRQRPCSLLACARRGERVAGLRLAQLRTDPQHAHQNGAAEDARVVVIHLVMQTAFALPVCADHALEIDH